MYFNSEKSVLNDFIDDFLTFVISILYSQNFNYPGTFQRGLYFFLILYFLFSSLVSILLSKGFLSVSLPIVWAIIFLISKVLCSLNISFLQYPLLVSQIHIFSEDINNSYYRFLSSHCIGISTYFFKINVWQSLAIWSYLRVGH